MHAFFFLLRRWLLYLPRLQEIWVKLQKEERAAALSQARPQSALPARRVVSCWSCLVVDIASGCPCSVSPQRSAIKSHATLWSRRESARSRG